MNFAQKKKEWEPWCWIGGWGGGRWWCSCVPSVGEGDRMLAALCSAPCDGAISTNSSGDKRRGISSVKLWLVAFYLHICELFVGWGGVCQEEGEQSRWRPCCRVILEDLKCVWFVLLFNFTQSRIPDNWTLHPALMLLTLDSGSELLFPRLMRRKESRGGRSSAALWTRRWSWETSAFTELNCSSWKEKKNPHQDGKKEKKDWQRPLL